MKDNMNREADKELLTLSLLTADLKAGPLVKLGKLSKLCLLVLSLRRVWYSEAKSRKFEIQGKE